MDKIKELKRKMLEMSYKAKEGHLASSFSCIDTLWVLYDRILIDDDIFILSKGHASLALYVVLAEKGLIDKNDLDKFCQYGLTLSGHPSRQIHGVITATGSLGHGLPIAVGIALAKKIKDEKGKVFCLVGDGEMQEGSCFEAILESTMYHLDNLVIIVDDNKSSKTIDMYDIYNMYEGILYEVASIDGHDSEEIYNVLNYNEKDNLPLLIFMETIKGNGCKMMVDNASKWHHKSPNEEEYRQLLEELS